MWKNLSGVVNDGGMPISIRSGLCGLVLPACQLYLSVSLVCAGSDNMVWSVV